MDSRCLRKRLLAGWQFLTLVPMLVFAAGCVPESTAKTPKGTEYIIFIDFSMSVRGEDRDLFEQELVNRVIPTLSAGDRILIAPITDTTLTKFRPLVEDTLPAIPEFNGWSDNVIQHKKDVKEIDSQIPRIKERLRLEVSEMFERHHNSAHTDIFSSLALAEKLFHNVPRRKVLILMSDMIEDYPPYRFDRVSWTPEQSTALLKELAGKGAIPTLPDVCVYISGASATSPDLANEIASFWGAYFEAAQADMHPSRYAHVLLHWPPSKACAWNDWL